MFRLRRCFVKIGFALKNKKTSSSNHHTNTHTQCHRQICILHTALVMVMSILSIQVQQWIMFCFGTCRIVSPMSFCMHVPAFGFCPVLLLILPDKLCVFFSRLWPSKIKCHTHSHRRQRCEVRFGVSYCDGNYWSSAPLAVDVCCRVEPKATVTIMDSAGSADSWLATDGNGLDLMNLMWTGKNWWNTGAWAFHTAHIRSRIWTELKDVLQALADLIERAAHQIQL